MNIKELYEDLVNEPGSRYMWCDPRCLRMKNHYNPVSISVEEAQFIYDFIVKHKFYYAFEACTGFGISSAIIAMALRDVQDKLYDNPKIVTLDSYIEERYNNSNAYKDKKAIYYDSDGWKSVNYLMDKFELHNYLKPKVGWSPDDNDKVVDEELNTFEVIDCVFIDGNHNDESLLADIKSVEYFMDYQSQYVIFLHDMYGSYINAVKYIEDTFGKIKFAGTSGYGLAYVTNIKE